MSLLARTARFAAVLPVLLLALAFAGTHAAPASAACAASPVAGAFLATTTADPYIGGLQVSVPCNDVVTDDDQPEAPSCPMIVRAYRPAAAGTTALKQFAAGCATRERRYAAGQSYRVVLQNGGMTHFVYFLPGPKGLWVTDVIRVGGSDTTVSQDFRRTKVK